MHTARLAAGVRALLALTWLSRCLAWLFLRLLPPRRHAVVHGWPDSEGNAVEMVRALGRRYDGRVVWLLADPAYAGPAFARADLADSCRIQRIRKGSLRGVYLALTAELTFFTHGLYTAVAPTDNRLVVNLWHGDGPKATRDTQLVRSHVVVSGSRLWGEYKRSLFGLPAEALAVVGNPRVDQFQEALAPSALGELGLTPGRKRVLWLPTYRRARGPRARTWADGENLTDSDQVRRFAGMLAEAARAYDVELLIKPHPLDVDRYADLGVRVLHDGDLHAAGSSLYQLMGQCDALISDVSSVWVDYLVLDRPIGFYLPDLVELERRRGLNVPDLRELLPGLELADGSDARSFVGAVSNGEQVPPSQWPGSRRIGAPPAGHVADRLLDWLTAYQLARGGRPLFTPAGR